MTDHHETRCKCPDTSRLDGEEAETYAADHLRLIERGRDSNLAEDYQCDVSGTAWVLDFPLRHWAEDHRGPARLRRLPLSPDAPPVGALD